MLSLFLGAGFSKWAVNLPLARELFDFKIETFGVREQQKFETIKGIKTDWDKKHPDGFAEQFIADAMILEEKERKSVLWYVTRRLCEPFIWTEYHAWRWRRHVLMINEKRVFRVLGMNKAHDFLAKFCGCYYSAKLAGIVTTNYDLIVEYSLGSKGFNYGERNQKLIGRGAYPVSTWLNPVILKGKVPLAKIHGSISWDNNGYYTDGRRGLTGNALIMPPTPDKQIDEALKPVWRLAEEILEQANQLIVFGFAFNKYDKDVLNLLQKAGGNLKSILLIDIKPNLKQAHLLWPNAVITSCNPENEMIKFIDMWLEGE